MTWISKYLQATVSLPNRLFQKGVNFLWLVTTWSKSKHFVRIRLPHSSDESEDNFSAPPSKLDLSQQSKHWQEQMNHVCLLLFYTKSISVYIWSSCQYPEYGFKDHWALYLFLILLWSCWLKLMPLLFTVTNFFDWLLVSLALSSLMELQLPGLLLESSGNVPR